MCSNKQRRSSPVPDPKLTNQAKFTSPLFTTRAMSFLRAVSTTARQLSRSAPSLSSAVGRRSFHSPFAFLSQSSAQPTQSQPSTQMQKQAASELEAESYEKEVESYSWAEPSGFVGKLHVVCDPDPDFTPYAVPIGAYPVSEPYAH